MADSSQDFRGKELESEKKPYPSLPPPLPAKKQKKQKEWVTNPRLNNKRLLSGTKKGGILAKGGSEEFIVMSTKPKSTQGYWTQQCICHSERQAKRGVDLCKNPLFKTPFSLFLILAPQFENQLWVPLCVCACASLSLSLSISLACRLLLGHMLFFWRYFLGPSRPGGEPWWLSSLRWFSHLAVVNEFVAFDTVNQPKPIETDWNHWSWLNRHEIDAASTSHKTNFLTKTFSREKVHTSPPPSPSFGQKTFFSVGWGVGAWNRYDLANWRFHSWTERCLQQKMALSVVSQYVDQ